MASPNEQALIQALRILTEQQRQLTQMWQELADALGGPGPDKPKGAPQAPARPRLRAVGSERKAA